MHFYIYRYLTFTYTRIVPKNFGTNDLNKLGLTEDSIDAIRRFCDFGISWSYALSSGDFE